MSCSCFHETPRSRCSTDSESRSPIVGLSPFVECRLDASSADPRKGPIGRTRGTVGDVLAPSIRPNRIDRLPNDFKGPERIYFADHDWLGEMMISVHYNLEAARRLDPLTVHGLPDCIHVSTQRPSIDNGDSGRQGHERHARP